jgi:hypothetical protein
MRAVRPLTAPDANRERLDFPNLEPLSTVKRREQR